MKHVKEYQNGIMYEAFLCRAFKCDRNSRKITHWNEDFDKVYNKFSSALDKFLTRRINQAERKDLQSIKGKLSGVYTKEKLIELVNEALQATQRHKEYIPR